ncbi:hypothetical protein ACLOJK_034110 [Asimina triloba]
MRPRRELEKRISPSNRDNHLSLRVVVDDDGGGRGKRPPPVAGFGIFWWRRESLRLFRWAMAGQSRKWMILVATIWVQAFTGTNFDFSSYSSDLKMVLGITQVQLNYLAVASDLGKAFGWSSGLAILHLPLPAVLFMSASMGAVGYGLQWLVVKNIIAVPYFVSCNGMRWPVVGRKWRGLENAFRFVLILGKERPVHSPYAGEGFLSNSGGGGWLGSGFRLFGFSLPNSFSGTMLATYVAVHSHSMRNNHSNFQIPLKISLPISPPNESDRISDIL